MLLSKCSSSLALNYYGSKLMAAVHRRRCQIRHKSAWNRAISDAEKLLGYPDIFHPLKSLPNDERSATVGRMQKLVGTDHPLLKIIESLVANGRQKRSQTRGLIMLLMAKLGDSGLTSLPQNARMYDTVDTIKATDDIVTNQRRLAAVTELLHTAHVIHKGVVNVSELVYTDGLFLEDLQFGNAVAILLGDYFLSNANLLIARLKNSDVVYMISGCIGDFAEGEFVFEQDARGNAVPFATTTMEHWEVKTNCSSASLLANSCKAIMMLGQMDEVSQARAFEFGKLLGLAWQISDDVQHFVDEKQFPVGSPFELISAPVILQLQRDPTILNYVKPVGNVSDPIDYKKIRALVNEGDAVQDAVNICSGYVRSALCQLDHFPVSDSRTALANIVSALKV